MSKPSHPNPVGGAKTTLTLKTQIRLLEAFE